MTIPNYRDAFTQFLSAQKEAVKFTNPNFTNSAITRERYQRLQEARETLRGRCSRGGVRGHPHP